MTQPYRITRIRCPRCDGTGNSPALQILACGTCGGAGKATRKQLVDSAKWHRVIGDGGYVAGDHDWEEVLRFDAEAIEMERLAKQMEMTP